MILNLYIHFWLKGIPDKFQIKFLGHIYISKLLYLHSFTFIIEITLKILQLNNLRFSMLNFVMIRCYEYNKIKSYN